MNFALRVGLALRCGERSLELVRVLPDGVVQLEEVLTRRVQNMREAELVRRVWSGRLKVVFDPASADTSQAEEKRWPALIDVSALKLEWQQQIEYRLRYVHAIRAAHVSRGQRSRIARVIRHVAESSADASPPSASAVMRWIRAYEKAELNPVALVSLTKARVSQRRLPGIVEKLIVETLEANYLTRDRHSLRHAHDCLRRELKVAVGNGQLQEAEATVSFTTLSRRVKDIDAYRRIAARDGDGRARMVCRTSIDGAGAAYPLQRVEVDHTPLNYVVVCPRTGLPLGRPLLTVALDAYSYYVLGFYLSFYGPGVSSVSGVLRSSVLPKDELTKGLGLTHPWLSYGLADEWVLDNGLEFHSNAFKRMSWELGIDVTYCRVRTPWLKPHVERFFGELDFLTLARGRVHRKIANVARIDPYKDALISFDDLVKGLTMFVAEVHPLKVNEQKLARPLDLFQQGLERCPPAVYPGSMENLRLITGHSKHYTVSQGGVIFEGVPYGSDELKPWRNEFDKPFKTLCKMDPDDMSHLYIQHPKRLTEWVKSPSRRTDYANGLSLNQHRTIRRFEREVLRTKGTVDDLWEARMRLHDHWMDATRPKSRKSSLLAARAAGVTSVGLPQPTKSCPTEPQQAPPPVENITTESEIPEFEAFDLEAR
ncbi:integrase catalytic domain-containing protein [Variovorax atrisoli]|uniref:integrase catalytic domain-containing protein n=1 Tax=Variovorax atrisoli TaxID=3394203 RepID=UPI00039A2485|nr:DDE-type integrase/transposase/recombinase [Variovorax paradoxus]